MPLIATSSVIGGSVSVSAGAIETHAVAIVMNLSRPARDQRWRAAAGTPADH
jgi:hypothetical protein